MLAHPKKLRIIAESTRKSDKLDAQVLAEFLALDMIPEAYRPTPRQREHRVLVRQRVHVHRRITSVKNKIRRILSNYNADREDLFTAGGLAYLQEVDVSAADRLSWINAHGVAAAPTPVAGGRQAAAAIRQAAPVAEAEARRCWKRSPAWGR